MGQRAEQSPHYLIGKKMPFSLSSTFAQSLSSFVRAVLPHTLCPACTRTHTHTHTHSCFGHRNIHLSPLLWKVKEKASALNFRWISCTHTPVILVVGSYTIWETPGCMGVQEASDGSLWVSDPVRLLPNKIWGGYLACSCFASLDRDSYNLFSEIYVLVIHLGTTKSHLLSGCKLSMKRRGLSTLNTFLME